MDSRQYAQARVVSSDSEPLILVDENDQPLGTLSKGACHDGEGRLHRAFSVFLFDANGRLLIQQRAAGKRLWPGYWANSCCSHPRADEEMDEATLRRVSEELGLEESPALEFVYKFRYHARYENEGSEHELCWVYLGRVDADSLYPNALEIAEWRFLEADAVDDLMNTEGESVAPWFRLEWNALRHEHADRLRVYLGNDS